MVAKFGSRFVFLLLATIGSSFADTETNYEYDDLGRLIQVTADDGTVVDYDLDDVGNRETITSTLPAANDPPTTSSDSVTLQPHYSAFVNLIANDTDPNGDPLTITSVTQPSNASVSIWSASTVYVTAGSSTGTSFFNYTISDGNGGTATGIVFVNVTTGGGGPPGP